MANFENDSNPNKDLLLERIQSLEHRLANIESMLRIEWAGEKKASSKEQLADEAHKAEEDKGQGEGGSDHTICPFHVRWRVTHISE